MQVLTGPTAIVVDGSDRPAPDGTVAFRVGAIKSGPPPRRPWTGLAIAVVTAVVTMGAMGPQPAAEPGVAAVCPPADEVSAVATMPRIDAAPTASLTPWWRMPRAATMVDPVTGLTVQAAPDPSPAARVAWWRLPQMALWIDPATALAMDAAAHEQDRVVDDHPRDR